MIRKEVLFGTLGVGGQFLLIGVRFVKIRELDTPNDGPVNARKLGGGSKICEHGEMIYLPEGILVHPCK